MRETEELDRKLKAVAEALWEEGCPVAGPQGRAMLVRTAIRRWRSFSRRSLLPAPSPEERVEDLARGLRDHLERDPALAGPLLEDYRYLARKMAQVLLESAANPAGEGLPQAAPDGAGARDEPAGAG
jgi:hypothetical protein